jgi:hypothetical protein
MSNNGYSSKSIGAYDRNQGNALPEDEESYSDVDESMDRFKKRYRNRSKGSTVEKGTTNGSMTFSGKEFGSTVEKIQKMEEGEPA